MVDDLPVGGGGGANPFGAEQEQPPVQAAANDDDDKPLGERIVSKAWASRKKAFEDLQAIIGKFVPGTNNEVMNEHAGKWPKYLVEPNPGAMEKVLECFQVFIDKCDPALLATFQDKVYAPIIDKCLGAAKPTLKAKALECMLLFFEVSENFGDETLDAFQTQVKSSKPKIAQTSMQLLAALMTAYGIKKFNPARFGPQIVTAANSSAPANRNEAMNCYKAIFQWVGLAGVEPFIEPLKEAQKVTLKKDFEALTAEKKVFKRKTRTEQEAARQAAIDGAIDAAMEEEKKEEVIDVFDISAPVDILSKFNADWCSTTLGLTKWAEKKAALDVVLTDADVPKLAKGDYSAFFEVLKKLGGDSHVAVAQTAIKCIGCLAKGLRETFHDMALQAVPVCFAKFKEKRAEKDIQQALEHIMMCIELPEIIENLNLIKTEKTPNIKMNIAIFIERAVLITYIDPLEEIADQLGPLALKITEEKDAKIREQGLTVLGVLLARVPSIIQKFVDPLIEAKKQMINAAKETVKITKYDKSEKKAAAAAAAAQKKAAAAAKAKPAAEKKPTAKKAEVMTFGDDDMAGDNVLDEVAPAKPRRPPPNIGKKPVKKAAAADEDELDKPDPPKRGPPARLAGKSGAAASSTGTAKIIKADDIQEEDIGSGMGKETALEKVGEFYDAAHVAKFEDAKWQEKKLGFDGLKEQIEQLKPDKVMVEATSKFIKAKMKDWKESNIVMNKESILILLEMTKHCDDIPKRAIAVYTPFLCEKIGDVKMSAIVKETLLNASEFCTAKFVSIQLVKKGLGTKAPNNIKESCNLLGQLVEDFGAGRVAIKETIDFAVFSANHANKGVRDAAMALFSAIYKHLGEKMLKFLEGVKPATMALVEAEFDKVTPYAKGEFQCQRSVRGEAAEAEPAAGGGGAAAEEPDALAALESALPRVDISKQLNAKLIKMFTEADWKLKVKGCEMVQAILKEAGMRIQPDGIGDLMEQIKVNFKAGNKAVLKQMILLMSTMAEAVGQPILKYNKKCLLPLMGFLADKAALLRADVIASANKWAEAIGAEYIIMNMCTYLEAGNPELRKDSLTWISENTSAIGKCEIQPMIKPLVLCLTDKSGPIRVAADQVIVAVMSQVGFGAFEEQVRSLKPAIASTVRPLLEKAKAKAIAANPSAASMAEEEDAPAPTKKPAVAKKTATASRTSTKETASKTMTARQPAAAAAEPAPSPKKPAMASTTRKTIPGKSLAAPQAAAPFQEDDGYTINTGDKERRAQTDSTSKWVHDDVKPAHLNACKKHSGDIFGAEVQTLMWTSDFKKHLKVIEKMLGLIETQPVELMEAVDVIFKWTAVKLSESNNTAFQSSVYDFYQKLFNFLIEKDYLLWDHEADVVIPLLCDKVGNNNSILRQKVKQLIKNVFEMCDQKKTLLMIIKHGATSKNLKNAGECLDEIAIFLRAQKVVPFGESQIKVIAKLVDSKDAGVRENALQVLSEIYKVLDEDIWRVVGTVPLKVKGLLEQRFRKVKGGLGSSSSNMNLSLSKQKADATPKKKVSPRRGGAASGSDPLTKSFNPGLKTQTPRNQPLKFNAKPEGGQDSAKQGLTRSFRPGTASQSNLTRSFGNRNQVQGFNAQRPQTAMNADVSSRQTMPPPTDIDQNFEADHGLLGRNTEVINFNPPQNNEMHFMDDDEDLRQQIQEMEGPKKEPLDPETQRQVDDIMKYISNLKYSSDLNKRVESLIALNDIIQAVQTHEKSMQHTANDLISAFTHVLIDIFERPRQDTPLRFAKYFVTIVNKTCQCPIIMSVVREQELYELGEQLLTRLLIDNLDKLGDEKEGEFILKNLNGSMLRCLENCNKTSIFCVLFNLLRRYKDNPAQVKLPGLIIKCLLKLSKILEKVINELEIDRVLLVIHLYLISIDHEKKTSNDDMGIRIVKTLVHETVKIKQHSILQSYKVVENHEVEDKHLHRWIKIILNTIEPSASGNSGHLGQSMDSSMGPVQDREFTLIITELKSTDSFQAAIPKLHNFLERNSHLQLDNQIRDLSQHFQDMIRNNLTSYRNQLSDSGSTPNGQPHMNSQPPVNPQDRPSFASQHQKPSGLGLSSQKSAEQKRFGFSSRPNATMPSMQSSASQPSDFSKATSGIGSMQASKPGVGGDSATSTDRMSSYQTKLSSMREKFQQRKTLAGPEPAQKSTSMASGTGASKNMNASFSAMNSSLQQRWRAVQTKDAPSDAKDGTDTAAKSNTMAPATANRFSTEVGASQPSQAMTASGADTAAAAQATPGQAGASNQDLNKRLLELKGKLAALKKN